MIDNNFKPTTILELLRYRSDNQPDKRAYTFLVDGKKEMPGGENKGDQVRYSALIRT